MGIAALVLGILSIILAIIPGCGLFLAPVPALIGLILGFVGIGKAKKENLPTGMAKAGAILSALALVILVAWIGWMATQKPDGKSWGEFIQEAQSQIEEAQQQAIEQQQQTLEDAVEPAAP